jgi:hypothetical protein
MAAPDVLIDTAGFLCLWDSSDEYHQRAVLLQGQLSRNHRRFLTTDYIVDETATLLLVRHSHAAAADFLQTVLASQSLRMQWIDSDRFHRAAGFFTQHRDKKWSFTDCVSFILMRELKLTDCFTSDHHFRQAGFNALLC